MPKTAQPHKATRIKKGFYLYRGYYIKAFDQKYLLDSDLKSVVWCVYTHPDGNSILIEESLSNAKCEIDSMLLAKI